MGSGGVKKAATAKAATIRYFRFFFRPSEVNLLHGDSSKAKKKLKWKPKTNLKKLVKIMVEDEIRNYKKY